MNETLITKFESFSRCRRRIQEEYGNGKGFVENLSRQDAAILNIQRACELVIDVAHIVIREHKLGLPSNAREAFDVLAASAVIDERLASVMKGMVGFRNIAVHEYQKLDLAIVESVIRERMTDLDAFISGIKAYEAS